MSLKNRSSAELGVRYTSQSSITDTVLIKFEGGAFGGEKIYGPRGARKRCHPPNLTRTERPRFIRAYYQLWGMMKLDPAKWQSRFESMTLKRLYELCEMTHLQQSIGREEVIRAHPPPCSPSYLSLLKERSKERVALEKRIWQHIEHLYQRVHEGEPESIWGIKQPESLWGTYELEEGAYGFLVIWDHWQGCLKQVVLGLRPVGQCTEPDFVKQYIWDDTSDEEV